MRKKYIDIKLTNEIRNAFVIHEKLKGGGNY